MGKAKLKVKAAQRYVPAATTAATTAATRSYLHVDLAQADAPVFVPLESVQWLQKEPRQEEKPSQPAPVEVAGRPDRWPTPPDAPAPRAASVVDGSSGFGMGEEASVHLDIGPEKLTEDQETTLEDDSADEHAEYVCCLPRVTLRRPDGVAIDVIAASLAGDGDSEASLHLGGGRRAVDPLNPVLYLDVQGGRIKLEGRLLANRSAHIATLSASGTSSYVRQRDAFRGVVVFHRLEWVGAHEGDLEEKARALPDTIAVELPLGDQEDKERTSRESPPRVGDTATQSRKRHWDDRGDELGK